MLTHPDFKELLNVFNAHRVRYLVVGGYAVMMYCEPRFTKDLDLRIMSLPGMSFEEAWPRRVMLELAETAIPFISKEDLIRIKRASGRPQDLTDAEELESGSE